MRLENWVHAYAHTRATRQEKQSILNGEVAVDDLPAGAFVFKREWDELQSRIQLNQPVDTGTVSVVKRGLVDAAQADSSGAKVDLKDECAALTSMGGGAGEFFRELLAAEPDRQKIRELGAPFNANVRFEKDGKQSTATVHFTGAQYFPDCLGGEWSDDVVRSVTVDCRYAKWRDRRTRRLNRVRVQSQHISPA